MAGCGGGSDDSDQLVVSAAASLDTAFNDYVDAAGIDAKMSFAGSDELAAQIRQGVKPDVYAAANTTLPDELHKEGLVGRADGVRDQHAGAGGPAGLADQIPRRPDQTGHLDRDGRSVGSRRLLYARGARQAAGGPEQGDLRQRALRGTRREQHLGQAHPGGGRRRLRLHHRRDRHERSAEGDPAAADLQPNVAYGAAVVTGAKNPDGARKFIDGLLNGDGATALREAGFKPPPG